MNNEINFINEKKESYNINNSRGNRVYKKIADELICCMNKILEENGKDIADMNKNGIKENIVQDSILDKIKIYKMCEYLVGMSNLNNPYREIIMNNGEDQGFIIKKIITPVKNIAAICGIDPHISIFISAMCLKCGNNVTLFGSQELYRTDRIIFNVIKKSIKDSGRLTNSIKLIQAKSRKSINKFLQTEKFDLALFFNNYDLENIEYKIKIPYVSVYKDMYCCYIDKKCDLSIIDRTINSLNLDKNIKYVIIDKNIHKKIKDKYGNNLNIKLVDEYNQAINYINDDKSLNRVSIFTKNSKIVNVFKSQLNVVSICVNNISNINNFNDFYNLLPIKFFINNTYNRIPVSLDILLTHKYLLEKNKKPNKNI